MFDPDIDSAIIGLIQEWDIAEERIKKAEFVNGNQIVASAIFELSLPIRLTHTSTSGSDLPGIAGALPRFVESMGTLY